MVAALTSYLQQYKSLSIPGLGTIYIERTPAQTDFTNKQILPPGFHYRFDRYTDAPDKDFFSFLAIKKNIADYEAIQWYNDWASQLRNRIKTEESVTWEGIGVLKKDLSGDIIFEAASPINSFLDPVPAHRVIRTNSAHTMLVGDKETTNVAMSDYLHEADATHREKGSWWIYALIIAAMVLIIIFFHFYKNGFNSSATGNQQNIESR